MIYRIWSLIFSFYNKGKEEIILYLTKFLNKIEKNLMNDIIYKYDKIESKEDIYILFQLSEKLEDFCDKDSILWKFQMKPIKISKLKEIEKNNVIEKINGEIKYFEKLGNIFESKEYLENLEKIKIDLKASFKNNGSYIILHNKYSDLLREIENLETNSKNEQICKLISTRINQILKSLKFDEEEYNL